MGIVYTIMMVDDFDWGYVGTSKEAELKKFEEYFEKEAGFKPHKIAEWHDHVIYDIDKRCPEYEPYLSLIKKRCDGAFYWGDNEYLDVKQLK